MKKLRLKYLKVFGLLFSMAIMCIAAFMPTETVQAKNIKNKTFVIKSDYPVTLGIQSLADNDKGGTDIRYYWPSGLGSITWSGYDWNTHSYTVTMKDVDVTKWTPYLEISADPTQSHYPKSITPTKWGGNGMNHGTTEVHNLQDISGYPDYRFMYIGLGYTADEIQVAFGEYRWYTTYDLNGGQGDNSTQSALRGSNITTHGIPTRHGYTFTHYHYSYNNGQYDVNANGALGASNWDTSNITGPTINLVAQWNPNPYTISYNSNKPSKASSSVTGSTGQTNLVYDQTGNLANNGFSITGWSFVNWNTKADGSGTTYQAGQQIKNMNDGQNTTLYAQWRPNIYTLILDDQYAVKSGTTLAFEKYDYDWYKESNAKTSLNNKVSIPSKTGQIFGGYYTGKEGNGDQWIDENGKIKIKANKISSENTVYAKWTPAVYKIALDNQGANKGEEGTGAVWEKYNAGFYSDAAATKQYTDSNKKIICPKKKNYTFGGYWTVKNDYNQSNGQQLVDGNGEINIAANTLFEKDSTVYARWIPNTYKINLDNQGADIDKGTSAYYEKYGILNYTSLAEYDVNTGIATLKYDYTGNTQTFTAPADGDYTLEVAGAQGGDHPSTSKENATSIGGQGGTSKGTIHLKAGETLYIEVGNKPSGYNGSYNGSDSGWSGVAANGIYVEGSLVAGGGATDIRKGGNGIDNRVIVAGGGGGATYYAGKAVDGAAGGGTETGTVKYITGISNDYGNIYTTVNKGANQTGHFNFTQYERHSSNLGGGCLSNPYSGTSYGFLYYLTADAQNKGFYGGGGGYWGGAFMYGNCVMAGGLGGSGYIGGVTNGSMTNGGNSGNGWAKISYNAKEIMSQGIVENYFSYTGSVQTFTAPVDGEYTLEAGGAQGGSESGLEGGKGGKSTGKVTLKKGETIYIYVGQSGSNNYGTASGTYNGGGAAGGVFGTAGGGATHIAKTQRGELKNYADHKEDVLIVAGGGGGASADYNKNKSTGGYGGGTTGSQGGQFPSGAAYYMDVQAGGGSQTSGGCAGKTHAIVNITEGSSGNHHYDWTMSGNKGLFGQGGSGKKYNGYNTSYSDYTDNYGAGGGGGWYGGGSTVENGGAGGGSGYTDGVTDGSMQTGVNEGNGYAKITYIDTDISDSSACSIRIPKKSGYTFDGYWTGRNQTGEEVVDATGAVCSSVTRFNDDNTDSKHQTTVYAHWTDNEYSVIYKSNYTNPKTGEVIGSPDGQYRDQVRYNRPYRVKDNMFNVPSGYKFKEWNTKQDGTGEKWKVYKTYKDEIQYNNTYSTTLYAIWEPDDNHYTVNRYIEKLDSDYGKPEDRYEKYDSKVISENVKTGSEIKVTAGDIEGFTFDKTQTKSDDIIGTDSNGYSTIRVKADGSTCINYYYTRNAYRLTLRKGNGITKVYGAGEEESAMIKYQDDVVIDADLDVDNGYSWSNWTNTSDNAVISKEQSYSFKMPAKNLDYTANANQDQKFTLTVIPLAKNDSSETSTAATWYDPVSKTTKTANKGTKITFTLNYNSTLAIANPDRTSFNYEGWKIYESDTYDAGTNTGTEIVPGKENSYVDSNGIFHMGNKNTTIVAQWNVISAKYQVNYWFQKADGNPDGKLADNYSKDVEWSYTAYADADSKVSPKVYTLMDCARETSNTAEEKAVNDLKEKLYGFYAPDMVTETVKADGTTVIDYKYTRSKINLKYNAGSDPNGNKASVKAAGYKTDANGNIQKSDGTDVTTTLTYGATNLKTADANTFNLSLTGYSLDKRQTWVNKILGLYLSGNQKMMPSEIMAVQSVIDKKFESETTKYIDTLDSKIIADKNWTRSYWNGLNYAERNRYREEYMINTANNKLAAQAMNSELQNMIKNSPVVLSANWEANSYDVTLNYNGATTKPTSGSPMGDASTIAADGSSATWNSYVQYDHAIPKVFGSDKIAKTGYTFTGWKNGDVLWNADGAVVNGKNLNGKTWSDAQGLYKYTGNTIVTAQWSENSYNIEFKANKPPKASNNVSGDLSTITNVKYTQSVTLKSAPSLTGWTFKGWNTQADGKGTSYNAGQSVSKLSATNGATVTLYAIWSENSYNIIFHGNTPVKPVAASSKVTGTVASIKNVKYETTFNLPKITGTKDAFALTGWKFAGWNRSETNGKGENNYRPVAYTDAQKVQGLSATNGATVNLYAQWDANKYTIHFDKNKPSTSNGYDKDSVASHDVTGEMADVEHTYDIKKALPDNKFKLHGWKFKGWNTKADGTGTAIPNKENVLNLTTDNNKTITLYAQWEATTYTITFNSNKPSKAVTQMTGTMEVQTLTYDKWENLHENKYKLEGWTFNKWNLKADGSSETLYKDKERVRNICDGKDTTLYAQWKDTTPPDASKTYLRATKSGNVNDPDYARALAVATKGSKDVTTSTSVTRTLDGLGSSTWTTSWINSDVSLDLYSYDNGTGIKLLTTYSGNNEWNKTKFTPSDNTKQVKSSKYDTSEGIEVFHGIATDDSNNSTATRNLTVKIDKTAPTGNFIVKTGTLKNPLAGTTSMIYDSNGMVTEVNPEGMRTEITATISDNGNENSVSGVKHVWAVVTDMENANISKSYKCNRISGDKYNGTYIAVDESGNKPNLYEDFSTSRKLKVKVYACDEAGNISVYKDREPSNDPNKPTSVTPPSSDPENNIVTNISMWSQIIRDDKEVPDTSYAIGKDGKDKDGHSAEGPAFLLNQSGKVHIVTYGYVEAVDVNFPPALQAAAQTDVAKGQTVKNLGTIANVNGAYVDNRLALNGGCARITDYPFIVPLYLDDTSVKTYKTNGDKWLDGITNGIKIPAYIPTANTYMPKKADGTYDIKTVDTVEIPYKGSRTVSGTAVPVEPYNKNECDLRTTASFYCAKDYASKQIISITDKLHTHLVN